MSNRKTTSVLILVLVLLLTFSSLSWSETIYQEVITQKTDVSLMPSGDYTKVLLKNGFSVYSDGEPDLPAKSVSLIIPDDMRVSSVRVISTEKVRLTNDAIVNPANYSFFKNSHSAKATADIRIYESSDPFPGTLAKVANHGFMRGIHIATVWVYPLEYLPAEYELNLYTNIQLELTLEPYISDNVLTVDKLSPTTIEAIKRVVVNPESIDYSEMKGNAPRGALSVVTDVPSVIITDSSMSNVMQSYADWKTKKGIRTEVKTVQDIANEFTGDSLLHQIRAYIKYMYLNSNTECVLLAGDINIIPLAYVYTTVDTSIYFDGWLSTDQYYSCLDYNWNENGDEYFGRPDFYGDTVDYYPEVYVGRLPVNTALEAYAVVNKLMSYESDTTIIDYQTRGLFSSAHFHDDPNYPIIDEFHNLSQALSALLPTSFSVTERYEQPALGLINEFNVGYGIISNYSHAACTAECFLAYNGTYPGNRQPVFYYDMDSLTNTGRYGFFLNSTCGNNKLDHVNAVGDTVSVAKSFLLNPNGGGIGYVGSVFYNYSSAFAPMHQDFFNEIFANNEPRPGFALATAKLPLVPQISWIDNVHRVAIFSYILLGDPELKIWTDTPKVMTITAPAWLARGSGNNEFNVNITHLGNPVDSALVCVMGTGSVYELKYTDSNGIAHFSIHFPTTGYASVVGSKHNYFYSEDSIEIKPEPSCPKLYAWNGSGYDFYNNILPHSEDELNNDYASDFYPIYHAPIRNGKVSLKILEDENELTRIRHISGYRLEYPENQRLTFTNKNRFRIISNDSLLPMSASLNGTTDVTAAVAKNDGNRLRISEPGYLILKYSNPSSTGKTGFLSASLAEAPGGLLDPPCQNCKDQPKVVSFDGSDYILRHFFDISAQDSSGKWQHINTIYPRYNSLSKLTELQNYFVGSDLTIKLEWTVSIDLDYLPYLICTKQEPVMQRVPFSLAFHSDSGNVASLLTDLQNGEVSLAPGQHLELEFQVDGPAANNDVAFVLQTFGKYEIGGSSNSPSGETEFQNYPNPFNPNTTFSFSLPKTSNVSIVIYNILGQEVKTVTDQKYIAGNHTIGWNSKANDGHIVASGVYFARFKSDDVTLTKKMMILK